MDVLKSTHTTYGGMLLGARDVPHATMQQPQRLFKPCHTKAHTMGSPYKLVPRAKYCHNRPAGSVSQERIRTHSSLLCIRVIDIAGLVQRLVTDVVDGP